MWNFVELGYPQIDLKHEFRKMNNGEIPWTVTVGLTAHINIGEIPWTVTVGLTAHINIGEIPWTVTVGLTAHINIGEIPWTVTVGLTAHINIGEIPWTVTVGLTAHINIGEIPWTVTVTLNTHINKWIKKMQYFNLRLYLLLINYEKAYISRLVMAHSHKRRLQIHLTRQHAVHTVHCRLH